MAISTPPRYVADIAHPKPEWSDDQRLAWKAAKMLEAAWLELNYAWEQRAIPSYEPVQRAGNAYLELERELRTIGLFAEEEVK